jgi:trk system potassium uptake protein TrkH
MKQLLQQFKKLPPGGMLMLYYALAILLGAELLRLPAASNGTPLSFLDALFTATSAQCVTGLVVVDTGTEFTLFGQWVILLLIQIGGLGITTFSVYLFIYLRIGVSVRGRWIINETLMHTPIGSWRELLRDIFIMTFVIEGLGTLLLCFAFIPDQGFWPGLYSALFHSVSAFCNAGFSLFSNSMVNFQSSALVNLTLVILISCGGLGFLVIRELVQAGYAWRKDNKRLRISLHSKIVLTTSLILTLFGTLAIWGMEYSGSLASHSFGEGLWISLFQSVSSRTAGFNSIDLNQFHVATLFLMILLMFIGASPGSCGGGIKTTSLALFFAVFYNRLKGSSHTSLFRRTIPDEAISKALTLTIMALILIGIALFSLLIAQTGAGAQESKGMFLDYLFETFSAFATVGLTTGATAQLSAAGKLIIILLMFVGRVGLLTMAFAIAGRARKGDGRYAEENIMIG